MTIRFEMFATGSMSTDALWAVVGDPWRLAEWTDVESVANVAPEPPGLGTIVETVEAGTTRMWRVVTFESRLMEIETDTERGRVAFGWRVVRDARGGSRLVLAGGLDRDGFAGRLRARLLDVPSLQKRMDRWAHTALRVAATPPGEGLDHEQ